MTVLVLAEQKTSPLVEMMFDVGFVPIVRRQMMEALERLRHEPIVAVAIDCLGLHTDVLEFVLNVRDTRPRVPIIVLGDGPEHRHAELLGGQERVFLLDRAPGMKETVKQILLHESTND